MTIYRVIWGVFYRVIWGYVIGLYDDISQGYMGI